MVFFYARARAVRDDARSRNEHNRKEIYLFLREKARERILVVIYVYLCKTTDLCFTLSLSFLHRDDNSDIHDVFCDRVRVLANEEGGI